LYKAQFVVDHWGSTENVQKLGVVAEIFLLKALEGVFTPLMEIKHNSVSLR